uniref:Envelope protein n=1 Tax=Oryzias sinensis TaxID=183150 RepID=A0A8C7YCX6_9TELE
MTFLLNHPRVTTFCLGLISVFLVTCILWCFCENTTSTYVFDLCSVFQCRGHDYSWRGLDVYICGLGHPGKYRWCPNWCHVWQATNRDWHPTTHTPEGKLKPGSHFKIQRNFDSARNPISVSISGLNESPYVLPKGGCWRSGADTFYILLGVDSYGKDPKVLIRIDLVDPPPPVKTPFIPIETPSTAPPFPERPEVIKIDYSTLKPLEVIQMSTGYRDDNLWLNWIAQNAREQSRGDCVACASARPHLVTEPAPLYPSDAWGFGCMMNMTKMAAPPDCATLVGLFPPIPNNTRSGPFTPSSGNGSYTCFNFTSLSPQLNVGILPLAWCNVTLPGSLIGPWARSGLYYYCGDERLLTRIPFRTVGVCAMVRLSAPLVLIGNDFAHVSSRLVNAIPTVRRRRHSPRFVRSSNFDLSVNSPTYIDAIGVPRGVPNEFKLADQIAAGFENLPVMAALFPITPNKNVDRINYVHYNVLRLANFTRDAVEGLTDQLGPTSLMAVQNRMALDMLLAEKGGVCAMFGDMCCTFIPNNTAPDGSVTRALEGLRILSETMHELSGVANPFDVWLNRFVGDWKGLVMSAMVSVAVFVAVLVTCGCCCIPCVRSLVVRLIASTIERQDPMAMMPLLSVRGGFSGFAKEDEEDAVTLSRW